MIEVILGALTAGALAATQDTAAQAIKDAYSALKGALVRKFGNLAAPVKQLEDKPESEARLGVLKEELETAKADGDSEVLKLAQALLEMLKQNGLQPGKVNTITDNKGIAIQDAEVKGDVIYGDKIGRDKIGTQVNHFGGGGGLTDAALNLSPEAHKLAKHLNEAFNLEELRGVCFELDTDWDNLRGETKEAKSRELVAYCARLTRLDELKKLMRTLRPNLREQLR